MGQTAVQACYTFDDYLRAEDAAEVRHEYVGGGVFEMASSSERHNRVCGNLMVHLHAAMRGSRCGVFALAMRLRIASPGSVYYPDVMLCCDPLDADPMFKTMPCVIVEVLSPSTTTTDRREKRQAYFALPSLQAYVLADSESRSVDYFLRSESGFRSGWLEEGSQLLLPCGDRHVSLSLDDIYEDVRGLSHPMS